MDDDATTSAPPPRPLWPIVAGLTVVVLALAVALVVVRAQDGRPHAAVGQVFDSSFSEDPLPHLGEVLLPWARVEVGADRPSDELPDLLGAPPTVQAPDGGSFVRVEVDFAEDRSVPFAVLAAPYTARADVVLRADGRDYPVSVPGGLDLDPDADLGQDGDRWVAVAGRPTDLEVRLTVDGVTQTVDADDGTVDAGQAADLAALPSSPELVDAPSTPCGAPRRLDRTPLVVAYGRGLDCRVQLALHTPYVDGLGWAAPGREFLVVQLVREREVDLTTGRRAGLRFWDSRVSLAAHLGDAEPLAPPTDVNSLSRGAFTLQDPDDPDQVVFDVARGAPTGDLRLDLVVQARLGEPFVTERRQARFEWTVGAGELA